MAEYTVTDYEKPPVKIYELATDFIENQLPAILEPYLALANAGRTTKFDNAIGFYEASAAGDTADDSVGTVKESSPEILFEDAMKAWCARTGNSPNKSLAKILKAKKYDEDRFNIRNKGSWKEVGTILEDARQLYMDKQETQGVMRKFWRNFGENNSLSTLKSWAQLVPSSGMTSVLSAGLTMIIDGAIRMVKIRMHIQKAMDKAATNIYALETAADFFNDSLPVQNASIDLLIAILDAMDKVVTFYLQNSLVTSFFKAIMGQESHHAALESSLEDIEVKATNLLTTMALAAHIKQYRIQQHVKEIQGNGTTSSAHETASVMNFALSFFREVIKMSDWNSQVEQVVQEVKGMKSQLDKLQQGNEQAAHGSQQLQLEEPHPIQTESKAASGRKKRPKKKPQIKPSCPQRLQASLLAYITQRNHNGLVLTDVEESLHSTATLPKSEQNRLGWITKADQLRQWLTSAEGGALLIHANSSIDGRVSVTTVLSSMLVRALQSESIRIVHVLAFFCGIHANLDDEDNDIHSGPVALIESLLDQLLRQPEENFSFDLSRLKKDMVKRATEGSLKCLVDLFVELVSQLRAEVVLFIIIDAVCYYEEDDIIDDTATILNELIVLATDPESRYCRCTVKLLLTTPTRTSALHEAFEEENLLEAPLNIDRGSELALLGGTPSCMKAKASDSDVPEVEYLESESEIYIST